MSLDKKYLLQTYNLALSYKGRTGSNPAVAAIIINNDVLVSYGVHTGKGADHAEVVAIKHSKSNDLTGATIYVSLEPCVHYGATPPCVNAIIAAKINRVVYAVSDPNPLVYNKAKHVLERAGVLCQHIPIDELYDFYEDYIYFQNNQRSFISLKLAMTKNRVIAKENQQPLSITYSDLNYWTHQQRRAHSAIITTAKTIIADNPSFNVRYHAETVNKPLIILSAKAKIPFDSKCLQKNRQVFLFHNDVASNIALNQCKQHGIICYKINYSINTIDFWQHLTSITASLGFISLWAEFGANITQAILEAQSFNVYYEVVSKTFTACGIQAPKTNSPFLYCENVLQFAKDKLFVYRGK